MSFFGIADVMQQVDTLQFFLFLNAIGREQEHPRGKKSINMTAG